MQKDKRGRVRFGYKGYRFELTSNSGINVYDRSYYGPNTERARYSNSLVLSKLLSTKHGRALMVEALDLVDAPQFTSAIHIPAHMKAVNS